MEVNLNHQLATFSCEESFPLELLPESLILQILDLLSFNHSDMQRVACMSKAFRLKIIKFGVNEKNVLFFRIDQAIDIFQKTFPQVELNKQNFEITSRKINWAQNKCELQSLFLKFKNDFITVLIGFNHQELNDFDTCLNRLYGKVESYKNLLLLFKDIIYSTSEKKNLLKKLKRFNVSEFCKHTN